MKTSLNSPFLYLLIPGCWAEPHRPASLAVAQPGDSDRDINGLIDGESHPKCPGATPHHVQQTASRKWQQSLLLREEGGYHL